MSLGFPFRFHPAALSVSLQDRLCLPPGCPSEASEQRVTGAKPARQDRAGWALQTERGQSFTSGPHILGGAGYTVVASREGGVGA